MKVGYFVTLKDERGMSHNAKVIKVHSNKSLNLQITHRNTNTQMYNGIFETPKIKMSRTPYWNKQNKPDTVKVVKETSPPKRQKKVDTTNKPIQTKI